MPIFNLWYYLGSNGIYLFTTQKQIKSFRKPLDKFSLIWYNISNKLSMRYNIQPTLKSEVGNRKNHEKLLSFDIDKTVVEIIKKILHEHVKQRV